LEKLSLGQKATVLIKIYLAHGDKPIIIDSHDAHLDNEFIMKELVKAIRQAKCFRQVSLFRTTATWSSTVTLIKLLSLLGKMTK